MEPNIVRIANLIGDRSRSRMLIALLGGKALTATELAVEADITMQTASSHLAKLVSGQILIVRKQGRHKYFQLHGPEIAELLEKMLCMSSAIEHSTTITGPDDARLRVSRICYDHLAGAISVALYQTLLIRHYLVDNGNTTDLTASGERFFKGIGVDFTRLNRSRRPICKPCLDWSERKNHLAGALGEWVLMDIIERGWASKSLDSRAIEFTHTGKRQFFKQYGVTEGQLRR